MNLQELYEALNNLGKNDMLSNYKGIIDAYDGDDWKQYVEFTDETYNRVLLGRTDTYEIFLICWGIGQASKIHDHPSQGCVLKMLYVI